MEMEARSMFWGIILKPDKRYEQVVEESFHVSKACLEPSSAEGGKVTTVYLEKDSDEFIICNLKGPNSINENLDLNFNFGEKICFRVEGSATVHLTGYLLDDDDDFNPDVEDDSMDMGDSLLMEEASSDDEEEVGPPQLVKKRKLNGTPSPANGREKKRKKTQGSALDQLVEDAKKSKEKEVKQAQSAKKALLVRNSDDEEDDSDEEEEDDDDDDDMDDSEVGEEEEVSDEEEEIEEEEEEEEKPAQKKPQTPVSSKKDKKNSTTPGVQNGTPAKKPATPKEKGDAAETPKKGKKNKDAGENKAKGKDGQKTPKRTLKGGLMVEDLKIGNGPEAIAGKHVGMYYDGTLQAGGKTFDSCKQGKPFKFRLAQGEVIKGWDVGITGMKVGGKRRLTVPPKLGYGAEGAAPDIPPNAVLVFDVECKSVN